MSFLRVESESPMTPKRGICRWVCPRSGERGYDRVRTCSLEAAPGSRGHPSENGPLNPVILIGDTTC